MQIILHCTHPVFPYSVMHFILLYVKSFLEQSINQNDVLYPCMEIKKAEIYISKHVR